MLLGEGLERERGHDVFPEADELQDGARYEKVDLPREALTGVELGQHLATAGAVAGVQEVMTGLGIPGQEGFWSKTSSIPWAELF